MCSLASVTWLARAIASASFCSSAPVSELVRSFNDLQCTGTSMLRLRRADTEHSSSSFAAVAPPIQPLPDRKRRRGISRAIGPRNRGIDSPVLPGTRETAWNCVVPGNVWFRLVLNVPGHIHGRRCCRAWTAHVSGAHQPADLVEDSRATWPSPWLIAH